MPIGIFTSSVMFGLKIYPLLGLLNNGYQQETHYMAFSDHAIFRPVHILIIAFSHISYEMSISLPKVLALCGGCCMTRH